MKKILYFAVMALFMAGMTACEDDPVNNGGNNGNGGNGGNGGGGGTTGPIAGTEWVNTESGTEVEDGITYEFVIESTLNFQTGTNGVLTIAMTGYANGTQVYNESENQDYTYTFEGTATRGNGMLTHIDEETHQPESLPFTISGNELTVSGVNDETGEPETMVFIRR